MARVERRIAAIAAAGLLALLAVGCQEVPQTPEAKQARLIAAENMQLQKDLADREKQLKVKDEQLAASRKRVETLQNDLQKSVAERVKQVTAAVMDDNVRLRKEIETLRAQLKQQPAP